MRRLSFFLILMILVGFSSYGAASLLLERGLRKGKCYEEIAALNCETGQCTLVLFPQTEAQLSLSVSRISPADRAKMGRLFKVRFRVLGEGGDNVEILQNIKIPFESLQAELDRKTGMLKAQNCP